jgi:hypothetical protein
MSDPRRRGGLRRSVSRKRKSHANDTAGGRSAAPAGGRRYGLPTLKTLIDLQPIGQNAKQEMTWQVRQGRRPSTLCPVAQASQRSTYFCTWVLLGTNPLGHAYVSWEGAEGFADEDYVRDSSSCCWDRDGERPRNDETNGRAGWREQPVRRAKSRGFGRRFQDESFTACRHVPKVCKA